MAKGQVKIEGLAELTAKLAAVSVKARAAAQEAVREEVKAVQEDAHHGAPVGPTGKLSGTISGEAQGLDGEVKTHERYATFVEHGTYKDPAQPFMGPAAERSRVRWPARAGALIKMAVEGLGK